MAAASMVHLPGSPVHQFSVMVDNRAGAISALIGLLESHGIFCLGFSTIDTQEAIIIRMILSDPDLAATLFLERGIGFTVSEMVVVSLKHGPASLRSCLELLFRTETNIDFVYPLLTVCEGSPLIAIHVGNPVFAREVLNSGGIRVLYQEDLSR